MPKTTYPKTEIEFALRIAGTYIVDLPDNCPYFLSCFDDEEVHLNITPRTPDHHQEVAAMLRRIDTVEEGESIVLRKIQALVVECHPTNSDLRE